MMTFYDGFLWLKEKVRALRAGLDLYMIGLTKNVIELLFIVAHNMMNSSYQTL